MATTPLSLPLDRSYLVRFLRRFYRQRLTLRGRFLLWAALVLAFVGVDTRRSLVFMLFAVAAPPLLIALLRLAARRPSVRFAGRLPARLTAGRALSAPVEIAAAAGRTPGPLALFWGGPLPDPALFAVEPVERYVELADGQPSRLSIELRPRRRGRYALPRLSLAGTDLFGLVRTKAVTLDEQVLLVYPRYYTLDELPLPIGRRYQPGGIPLASEVGDSLEFIGTREYREGDALRKIHWRSWARLGKPVVREFQEEYFSRLALVLDTFLPAKHRPRERERFEAAISLIASVAEHMSRSEEIVDILAAGPDLYEVSTGRSLGYLDNVLDVLACLEPSPAPPFETIGPPLFERLEQLTTVVVILLEWDDAREAFLRRVRAMGVAVRVLLVHEGETRKPWTDASAELGEIVRYTPAQIEARLAAEATT